VQVEGAGGLALARAVKGARHMLKLDLGGNTLGSPIAAELGGALPAYIGTRLQVCTSILFLQYSKCTVVMKCRR
jgi:hypothetical protein